MPPTIRLSHSCSSYFAYPPKILDVLWQKIGSDAQYPDGKLAIWYMAYNPTGRTWRISTVGFVDLLVPRSQGWEAVAVGDCGRGIGNPVTSFSGVRDGFPDIVLRNSNDQTQAIWALNGATGNQTVTIGITINCPATGGACSTIPANPNYLPAVDWRLLGATDYGGYMDGSTSYTDVLFRRLDFADAVVWQLQGNVYKDTSYVGPTYDRMSDLPTDTLRCS